MKESTRFEKECETRIEAFCRKFSQHGSLILKSRQLLKMLHSSGIPLRGKPSGWAGGIIHVLTYKGCGVPGVLNSELEQIFGISIGTIRKRSAQIDRLVGESAITAIRLR